MSDLGNPLDGEVDLVEQPRRPSKRVLALGGAAVVALALGGGAAAMAAAPGSSSPSGAAASTGATSSSAPATSKTPPVRTPHLEGKVKSVSGTKILITDPDGFTRTIITSSATKYRDGLTASPSVGTEIHAEGKVAADGTDLDATSIGKGHGFGGPGGPGRRGGPGGFGHGGPGPHGGTPPSGGPTPPSGSAPSTVPTPKSS